MNVDRYAVIGDPIGHSLSPAVQNAAFRAAGLSARYEAVRVAPERLNEWVEDARTSPYRGFNVTIPHKERTCELVDSVDETARAVGAVNTVVNRAGTLYGYNTDVPGFLAVLAGLRIAVRGLPSVVIGAGGSARAVVYALAGAGAEVTIANRDVAKARRIASLVHRPVAVQGLADAETLAGIRAARLIVNSTPLGMAHLPISPLPSGVELPSSAAVIDLVYGRTTPLIRHARAAGCLAVDGTEMLVQQGAESFRHWTGIDPDLPIMREACRRQLMEVQACSAS